MSAGAGISWGARGVIVDTNLLVLFTVGTVNRNRVETFKRTRQYTTGAFDLLVQVLKGFDPLYTVPHVLAEVSNLTDPPGSEGPLARSVLRQVITLLSEVEIPSARAAEDRLYEDHGLADAAIGAVARAHNCGVLTDDLDLYLRLSHDNVDAFYFTYLRDSAGV